jgi:hypothetical protein
MVFCLSSQNPCRGLPTGVIRQAELITQHPQSGLQLPDKGRGAYQDSHH